jgi:hypothetical protein
VKAGLDRGQLERRHGGRGDFGRIVGDLERRTAEVVTLEPGTRAAPTVDNKAARWWR